MQDVPTIYVGDDFVAVWWLGCFLVVAFYILGFVTGARIEREKDRRVEDDPETSSLIRRKRR